MSPSDPFPYRAGFAIIANEVEPFDIDDTRPAWNGKSPFPDYVRIQHVERIAGVAVAEVRERFPRRRPRVSQWSRGLHLLMLWGPRAEKGTHEPDDEARPSLDELEVAIKALFRGYSPEGEMDWLRYVTNGDTLQRHWKALLGALVHLEEVARGPSKGSVLADGWRLTVDAAEDVKLRVKWDSWTPVMPDWFDPSFESVWRACLRLLGEGHSETALRMFRARFATRPRFTPTQGP